MTYTSINDLDFDVIGDAVTETLDPHRTIQFYKNNSGHYAHDGSPDRNYEGSHTRHTFKPVPMNFPEDFKGSYNTPFNHVVILYDDKKYICTYTDEPGWGEVCNGIWLDVGNGKFFEVPVLTLPEDHPGSLYFVKQVRTI